MADREELLRRSVDLEARSDLLAVACDFRGASLLMKEANAIRADVFGRGYDPNGLRGLTADALRDAQDPLRAHGGGE